MTAPPSGGSGVRLLTIMGSGETAPTMAKVHRTLVERVGEPAVLLDTPYGFQENADDISERTQQYFDQSVGHRIEVATYRSTAVDAVTRETARRRLEAARYVFAGPGSPSYALRQWVGTAIPATLAAKLATGGAVTFASAAALTLGVATVPVYEIYKAGESAHWLPGLDLLGAATGLRAAVIPHFDNAEGGHYDTRYCYLGERRLATMEAELAPHTSVIGVDEHTAAIFDVGEATVTVLGRGGLTLRRAGRAVVFPAGSELSFAELAAAAEGRRSTTSSTRSTAADAGPATPANTAATGTPLMTEAARLERDFGATLDARDTTAAVNAVLELEQLLVDWSADTTQSDEPDRVRARLRSMVVRLGEVAALGARDQREVLAPLVEAVLAARRAARAAQAWATADELRDRLRAAGVEVRDTTAGEEWDLIR